MNSSHKIDPEFKYASPFVKKALVQYASHLNMTSCLDIPCGNGRNTFLLATYFQSVTAIDNNEGYLNSINENIASYQKSNAIATLHSNILQPNSLDFSLYQFVCNVHFYEYTLIEHLIASMSSGALFLMETPTCNGENFRDLPNETELKVLFAGHTILLYDFRQCAHVANIDARGSVKALLQI